MDKEERVAKALFEEAAKTGNTHSVWADLKATVNGVVYDGQQLWLKLARVAILEMESDD